jgi:nicotinamidase-related amidase
MAIVESALPRAYEFPRESVALIMIDMQRDFLEPGGFGASLGNDVTKLAPSVAPAAALLAAFRRHGLPIIHTRECHKPDLSDLPRRKWERGPVGKRIGDPGPMGRILVAGEPGSAIVPSLAPEPGEIEIDKPGKGAFYATPLQEALQSRGISHLVFGGVTTEVCVQTTMREANDRGYVCILAEDATDSYFPEFKAATIAMIRAQGAIVGWTATAAQIVAALDAGG